MKIVARNLLGKAQAGWWDNQISPPPTSPPPTLLATPCISTTTIHTMHLHYPTSASMHLHYQYLLASPLDPVCTSKSTHLRIHHPPSCH